MNDNIINTLFLTDSYKISHHLQYPPDTTKLFSYFESRGGKWDKTLFFGLQIILKKYLSGVVVTQQMIEEADIFFREHFGTDIFNRSGWELIVTRHGGKLPVRIRAVPEGSLVPVRNVLFTVENTDPDLAWLTNYLETLLVQTWYPMTVATNSWACKQVIRSYIEKTADSPDNAGLEFKLHDFGFRGVSSVESAGIGGAAHLVNFLGTDTLAGIVTARRFYGAGMAGLSIPATEHSTMTTWGREGGGQAVTSLWDVNEGKQLPGSAAIQTGIDVLVIDPYIFSSGNTRFPGLKIWDMVSGRLVRHFQHPSLHQCHHIAVNGPFLVVNMFQENEGQTSLTHTVAMFDHQELLATSDPSTVWFRILHCSSFRPPFCYFPTNKTGILTATRNCIQLEDFWLAPSSTDTKDSREERGKKKTAPMKKAAHSLAKLSLAGLTSVLD